VKVEVQDVAAAEGCLACFTHWRARFVPRSAAAAPALPPPGGLVGAAAPVPRPGAPPAALADASADEGGEAGGAHEAAAAGGANGGGNNGGGNGGGAAAGRAVSARVASALPHVQRAAHELPDVRDEGAAAAAAAAPHEQHEPPALAAAREAAAAAAAAARDAAAAAAAAAARRPAAFEVEGVEVDVFSEQQLLQAIWVFRGPLDVERGLFLEQERAEAAARAASEAAEQAALRAERRAQREAQLQDLLAWAVAGQQHFEGYIGSLKRQIARQRELLGHRLGSPSGSTASDDGERDG
jgi:hypothetical protein